MSRLIELTVREHGNTLIGTLKDDKIIVLPLRLIVTVLSIEVTVVEALVYASTTIESPFKFTVNVGAPLETVLYS
jgi:hypothetical protein